MIFSPDGGGRQVALLLVGVAPFEDGHLTDRNMPGKEGPQAGPLAADADEGLHVSRQIAAAAAVFLRRVHAEQPVFLGQLDRFRS